jgi:DNA adenine methylase
MQMSKIPHPIQYQGSKRNLASQILEYFPSDIHTLYEPFAGSAAISIAAAALGLAKQFVISDLNKPLICLLQEMTQSPQRVSSLYQKIWMAQGDGVEQSLAHFNAVRDEFNQTQASELLLYLLARCVKGAVRYNRQGQFNQSPDKRRKGTRPDTMQRNIKGVSYLLKGRSRFLPSGYMQAIEGATPNDLVYMDPPYQGVSGERDGRYLAGLGYLEFANSLIELNQRDISYIVSYDGRLGNVSYGQKLPDSLGLTRLELDAGRSSTATLLGRDDVTIESLYLSPALVGRLAKFPQKTSTAQDADSYSLFTALHDYKTLQAVH